MTGYTYQPASGTSTECLFVKNLQGDVERVISATGTLLASYTYDAWGNLCQSSGSLADINPIRYRSYYYDSETGLYYLQSRYYDQQAGRFVNADEIVSTESVNVGLNAFSYCENVPVSETDSNGTSPYGKLNIFDYGAIHRGVQSRCKACYGWKMEVYVTSPLGNGRLDLFDDMNCAYYEVKSISAAQNSSTQMLRYDVSKIASTKGNQRKGLKSIDQIPQRGTVNVSGQFDYGLYDISYFLLSDGLIGYTYSFNIERAIEHYAIEGLAALLLILPELAPGVQLLSPAI